MSSLSCFHFLDSWRSGGERSGGFLPPGSCASSARSGGSKPTLLEVAARYVEADHRRDISKLCSMLAEPCDFFGELATSEGVERHLKRVPRNPSDRNGHVEITKPFELADGDPHTVEYEYVRTWQQGEQLMQVEVFEYVTFAQGAPLVARVGYTRKPSDPVALPLEQEL